MRLAATLITGFSLLLAVPAAGQETPPTVVQSETQTAKPLGAVQSGNTTIIFAPADSRDIDTARLRTWEEFADAHPGIARTLAYKPSLMNDPRYLKGHPELDTFFRAHPDIKSAMADDPGNFAAIPPRPGE